MSTDEVATEEIAGSGIAGTVYRDPPVVTVTAPIGPQSTSTVTVTWTYSSPLSKPQYTYRVRIQNEAGTVDLFDSGELAGTDVSYAAGFVLSGGSAYRVRVDCSDGIDTGYGIAQFSSDVESTGSYELADVGAIYEVAINGVGYMLADSPEQPYKRSTGQLQAPRLATGSTPFSEAIERYTFVGSGDWSGGAGQRVADRANSDPTKYWESESVDPFTPGQLVLLNATSDQVASALTTQGAVVASGDLFVWTDTDELSRLTVIDGSPTTMTFTGDTLVDITSDGTYWYALNTDDEIFRGTDTTVGSVWSDLSTPAAGSTIVEWCSDRLAVVYTNPSGQSVLSTLAPAGGEEVTNGRFIFDDAEIVAVTSGDGYIWFAVNRDDHSTVYAWQLGADDDSRFIALEMPKGEYVTALGFYLGNVMVRSATYVDATTTRAIIYRAIPSDGALTPERIATLESPDVDQGPGAFTGLDRFVLFSYNEMGSDGRSGVGAIDLSTGGWCRWLQAPDAADDGTVQSIFVWQGKLGFTVAENGAVLETTTPEASGYLTTSVSDLGSSLTKVVDEIEVVTAPLPASSQVTLDMSTDEGSSFDEFGSFSTPGLKGGTWSVDREARAVSARVTIETSGSLSPKVRMLQYKLHALSVVDTMVELPVDCSDRMSGVNGVEIQDDQVTGLARARTLESLVGTRVSFQDVDYPVTETSEIMEVVSAVLQSQGTYDRLLARRAETAPVCLVTLRRAQ